MALRRGGGWPAVRRTGAVPRGGPAGRRRRGAPLAVASCVRRRRRRAGTHRVGKHGEDPGAGGLALGLVGDRPPAECRLPRPEPGCQGSEQGGGTPPGVLGPGGAMGPPARAARRGEPGPGARLLLPGSRPRLTGRGLGKASAGVLRCAAAAARAAPPAAGPDLGAPLAGAPGAGTLDTRRNALGAARLLGPSCRGLAVKPPLAGLLGEDAVPRSRRPHPGRERCGAGRGMVMVVKSWAELNGMASPAGPVAAHRLASFRRAGQAWGRSQVEGGTLGAGRYGCRARAQW